MPVITQEDQFYLRSREDLLLYEDARFQSLINALANYYTTRNDQSIWGAFLRAISMELARIEYMYSYDIVAKNPTYLTPADVKRQYAAPLYITGIFQQSSQFDMGDFGASSFGGWKANTGAFLRAVVLDSNGNLQVATTPGQTGLQEPSWALSLGETTTDGSVVWTNSGPAPAPLTYPVGYRDMLVDLLGAYQEGATPQSIQDVIYAYTGKNIVVEELYKQIVPGGFYDQSDRNTVLVSVNVGGSDPFTDVESLTELQQITNTLYGAIDLAKPAHVGLEFTAVFGSNENVDCFLSPRYLTQFQLNTLTKQQMGYYSLVAYVLTQPPIVGWIPLTEILAGTIIQDSNGNIQLALTSGITGTILPTWNPILQGTTMDGLSSPPLSPPTSLVWINIGTQQITIAAYAALPTSQQGYYQGYYQNTNCTLFAIIAVNQGTKTFTVAGDQISYLPATGVATVSGSTGNDGIYTVVSATLIGGNTAIIVSQAIPNATADGTISAGGIDDILQIIVQQVEEPPFNPMLYQAPIFDVNNPTTTLSSYGRRMLSPILPSVWQQLTVSPQVWSASTAYPLGTLVRGRFWGEDGNFNAGMWTPGGWQLYRALQENTNQDPLADTDQMYWTPLPSPSIYQAYYQAANGLYVFGTRQWAPSTPFYTGQFMIDNYGSLQIASSGSSPQSPPQSPPTPGITSPIATVGTSYGAVQILNNQLTLAVNSTTGMGLVANTSLIALLGFTYATFLNGLTLLVTSFTSTSITMSIVHSNYNSETQLESVATARIGFSQSSTVPTYDGSIVWRFIGSNYLTNSDSWIQVIDTTNTVTGEVANWDINHPMGLLAPRQDLVWEIGGSDILQSYEYE
jgi:hypothetical protein